MLRLRLSSAAERFRPGGGVPERVSESEWRFDSECEWWIVDVAALEGEGESGIDDVGELVESSIETCLRERVRLAVAAAVAAEAP